MRALGLLLLGSTLLGCGPTHIAAFAPKQRKYEEGQYAVQDEQAKPVSGSIYSEAVAGYLEDTRAVRAGDLVLIRINEDAAAEGGAQTDLTRQHKREAGLEGIMGLVPAIHEANPKIDPAKLFAIAAQTDFHGDGQTSRKGKLSGTIAVKVKKELPNGDLFVEGTKVVMINNEEYHLYISGVCRTADIARDNSVPSSLIADAQVEFTGRGDVADQVQRGWLAAFWDVVKPF